MGTHRNGKCSWWVCDIVCGIHVMHWEGENHLPSISSRGHSSVGLFYARCMAYTVTLVLSLMDFSHEGLSTTSSSNGSITANTVSHVESARMMKGGGGLDHWTVLLTWNSSSSCRGCLCSARRGIPSSELNSPILVREVSEGSSPRLAIWVQVGLLAR